MAGDQEKWHQYYSRGVCPWDSGGVSSQLQVPTFCFCSHMNQRLVEGGILKLPPLANVLELGCGTGASCVWLVEHGYAARAVGVDIVPSAIAQSQARAAAAGVQSKCEFVVGDALRFREHCRERFDLVYDCQTFHALWRQHPEIASVLAASAAPDGHVVLLTGNDREPEVGPSVLSRSELLGAFIDMHCAHIEETRFDRTLHYASLPRCPLAWCVVLCGPACVQHRSPTKAQPYTPSPASGQH